jgi:uncharacterized integral membrane protein
MRALLKFLVLAPITLLILAFSLANRQLVTIVLDPFGDGDGVLPQFPAPLYVVVLASVMCGVILGGVSTWMRQGRHRSAVREARSKTADLLAENETLRGQVATLKSASPRSSLPASRSAA